MYRKKHTVVLKKTSRGIFENVQCFFKNIGRFFKNNGCLKRAIVIKIQTSNNEINTYSLL